jgi:hypothetical protein
VHYEGNTQNAILEHNTGVPPVGHTHTSDHDKLSYTHNIRPVSDYASVAQEQGSDYGRTGLVSAGYTAGSMHTDEEDVTPKYLGEEAASKYAQRKEIWQNEMSKRLQMFQKRHVHAVSGNQSSSEIEAYPRSYNDGSWVRTTSDNGWPQ